MRKDVLLSHVVMSTSDETELRRFQQFRFSLNGSVAGRRLITLDVGLGF